MLRFTRMEINNFGPYKGEQHIDFTERKGVTIFWGDNGAGKTTLLNAFRYALFGVVHKRSGTPLGNLRELINREGLESGICGFSVALHMVNDGDRYDLIRMFRPREGVRMPEKDDDYEQDMILKKNGGVLSQAQSQREISLIMPEKISRFFLFDGELLQEYEELVQDGNSDDRIKSAIEKILGLPILANAHMDLTDCLRSIERQRNRAAQQDTKTQQAANQIRSLQETIDAHKSNIDQKQEELQAYRTRKREIDEQMSQTSYIRGLIADDKRLDEAISSLESKISNLRVKIQAAMSTAWKGMLQRVVSRLTDVLDKGINELERKNLSKMNSERIIDLLKKSVEEKQCSICGHALDSESFKLVENLLRSEQSGFVELTPTEKDRLTVLRNSSSNIRTLNSPDQSGLIKSLEDQLNEVSIELDTVRQQQKEVRGKIQKADGVSGLEDLPRERDDLIKKIALTEKGIADERKLLADSEQNKKKLSDSIQHGAGSGAFKRVVKQFDIAEKLFKIFEIGKAKYRDELKKKVQDDASSIFVKLSRDKDYVRLEINDNYGLTIVHKGGEHVKWRSSGYEHIVALALIAALHRNAPLRGPIIMDSPFGRLDPTHTNNVMRLLPQMEEQTILLAYKGEIDRDMAAETLGASLVKEYELTKHSSFFTSIN